MKKLNVLIVGRGGREHALAWKCAQSPMRGKLYCAPGNYGTSRVALNVPIVETDVVKLREFARVNSIGLTIVGPDEPLALGIVDDFAKHGLKIFGPAQAPAKIEWSKAFAKDMMKKAHIPTAPFRVFDEYRKALAYVYKCHFPVVVKASGLAQGKGVSICRSVHEAQIAVFEAMQLQFFGAAGKQVVMEEYLDGPELSAHALIDGSASLLWPVSQDYKRVSDHDNGANTGGMGSIAPVPWVTADVMQTIKQKIVDPALYALARTGTPFVGCLYPGIKMTTEGPQVLEYNARFGDPEMQSYMRILKTDVLEVLMSCVDGTLGALRMEWHPVFAACVVLASHGYPGEYRAGIPIRGVKNAERMPGVVVFHAGTRMTDKLRTAGGRVLGVTATGATLREALDRAYDAVRCISFEGMHYRTDIGVHAL